MTKPNAVLKIRQARLEDMESIRRLLSIYKLPLDGLENTLMWIIQKDSESILGVAGLEVGEEKALLRSVAVNPDFQNRGYGSALVKHLINEAKKKSIHELLLMTTTAPTFFRKLGFIEVSREYVTGSITDSAEFKSACPKTATVMRLSLR